MKLLSNYTLGDLTLKNRVVLAPMTRSRTNQPDDTPSDMMVTYYGQRATAGLIITEATQISQQGKGYDLTPGIYTDGQIQHWKKVTDEVHAKGGKIYSQLWHVGRVSHPLIQKDGQLPVAPSAIKPVDTQVYIIKDGQAQMIDCEMPKALEIDEILDVINDFRQAAKNAMEAGFDGVEIHGANGYLIDQFLRTNSNKRTDQYGGSVENRTRILEEIVQAVCDEIGKEKVGIRLAPYVAFKDMDCLEIVDTILYAAKKLQDIGIGYIHLSEADFSDALDIPEDFRVQLRNNYKGTIVVAGSYTKEKAEKILNAG
ncbi:MAG: alkene reductase, partial [Ostreibacterium sp.]